MKIIKRNDIESIHNVHIDGVNHSLGTVKIFSSHPALAELFPSNSDAAFSWVHLGPRQRLTAHTHDEPSLILICEGSGYANGEINQAITAGDAVLVSSGDLHGFDGGEAGFWGLSIQFSGRALYQDITAPRVQFLAHRENRDIVEQLLQLNELYLEKFKCSALMDLVADQAINCRHTRSRLLECLQVWSDAFQSLLYLRVAYSQHAAHRKTAKDHLLEEIGHNDNLRVQRADPAEPTWDAIMALAISWFKEQMCSAPDAVKTMIMHLVIESSGELFHSAAAAVFTDMPHFKEHGDDDGNHVDLGLALLNDALGTSNVDLVEALQKAWDVMFVLCNRMAELAIQSPRPAIESINTEDAMKVLA